MFCGGCGANLPDGSTSCNICGKQLVKAPSSANGALAFLFQGGKNIAAVIAAALCILGSVLPYLKVEIWGFSQSAALTQGADGFIVIALAAGAIACAILKKKIGVLGCGAGIALMFVFELIYVRSKMGEYAEYFKYGIGFYLLLIGAIGVIAAAVYDIKKN